MSTFASQVLAFNKSLTLPSGLPSGVEVINSYTNPEVQALTSEFYTTYFSDNSPRTFILGINPGRFGSGVTGIPYTDPVALEEVCGIENTLPKRHELTSEFFYRMVTAYGGPAAFYRDMYPTAVSPVGFVSNGKNLNYYDDPQLYDTIRPFIVESLQKQLQFGARNTAIILGTGRNMHEFTKLNDEYHFFVKVYALEHPRYVMQYKRKEVERYVKTYRDMMRRVSGTVS